MRRLNPVQISLAVISVVLVAALIGSGKLVNLQRLKNFYYRALQAANVSGTERRAVPCGSGSEAQPIVILAVGQSNAANYTAERSAASQSTTLNFYRGRCYPAQDPMLGADGRGGSVWPRVGDLLGSHSSASSVIIANVAVGGTAIHQWSSGGEYHKKLQRTLRELRQAGLRISHLLWHQGESDAKYRTTASAYVGDFMDLKEALATRGHQTPMWVARTSYCQGRTGAAVRRAQNELINSLEDVYAGPDTDVLVGITFRYDDCHFTKLGAELVARAWVDLLANPREKVPLGPDPD